MRAEISEQDSILVVCLQGYLNYDSVEEFSEISKKYLQGKSIVFDFKDLFFVGSIGISDLIQSLVILSQSPLTQVVFARLNIEYLRVLAASEVVNFRAYDAVDSARMALLGHPVVGLPLPFAEEDQAAVAPAPEVETIEVAEEKPQSSEEIVSQPAVPHLSFDSEPILAEPNPQDLESH